MDRSGFPLEIACYEGNEAETATIIPVLEQFQERHQVADMVVVADAGMLSAENLQAIHSAKLRFYVPLWAGMGFTTFVSDVYSRRIVGWRTHHRMPTDLPLDALEMALWVRQEACHDVTGVIHHSDAGSQYTAIRYADRLSQDGAIASIGTVGDSYDNAMAESVIGLYKAECVRRDGPFRTVDELKLATLMWVDWFNIGRLHSSIGYVPPAEYETTYYAARTPQDQPVPGEPALH